MKLSGAQIIEAALALLQEDGLEGVTFRKLQTRLSVTAPTLYWRFHSKAELLNAMSEHIIAGHVEIAEVSDRSWRQYVIEALTSVREAMLTYKDGSRIVADAGILGTPSLASIIEEGLDLMRTQGVLIAESSLIIFAALHYTFGHVIEEQTSLDRSDQQIFLRTHPLIQEAVISKSAKRATSAEIYLSGLERILG
ncbi:MAG TPA: TetR family transcriptional regulator [Candidatus Saccharimonadales bacterium]|nr:TetR family transcriptional regulator [Candidatus Saccharimonadales bacterium]